MHENEIRHSKKESICWRISRGRSTQHVRLKKKTCSKMQSSSKIDYSRLAVLCVLFLLLRLRPSRSHTSKHAFPRNLKDAMQYNTQTETYYKQVCFDYSN